MLSDAIRKRLETLSRREPAPATVPRPMDRRQTPASHVPTGSGTRALANWFEQGQVIRNSSGCHYRLRFSVDRFWREVGSGRAAVGRRGANARTPAGTHPELSALADGLPRHTLFLDLETCGFAGSAIFLIGLLRPIGARLAVELLLARDYGEERAILETFWSTAGRYPILVTFNGKSFDWPMIRDRSIRHHLGPDVPRRITRMPRRVETPSGATQSSLGQKTPRAAGAPAPATPMTHCDLLHHARRRWRAQVPDCKLQTLERYLCGRRRDGDIPGSQIPDVYHQFVRTRDGRRMRSVVHHNALDLITLLDLAQRLVQPDPFPADDSAALGYLNHETCSR